MKNIKTVILLSLLAGLFACSDDNKEKDENVKSGDHVWKHQTDALKTSKDAAKKLQERLNQQQKLDENN